MISTPVNKLMQHMLSSASPLHPSCRRASKACTASGSARPPFPAQLCLYAGHAAPHTACTPAGCALRGPGTVNDTVACQLQPGPHAHQNLLMRLVCHAVFGEMDVHVMQAACTQMPTLHRLSVFRDDLVFLVYIYQRWVYRVDKRRANEFGCVLMRYKLGRILESILGSVSDPARPALWLGRDALGAGGEARGNRCANGCGHKHVRVQLEGHKPWQSRVLSHDLHRLPWLQG